MNILLLLLRNLLPQQHATSSIPSRSVTQSLPAGVWKSVSNLYPLHIMLLPPCWLLDFISHSTNPKIEFYYDRERHITRVKLYNVYVIYYHKGGSIYLGRRCWLDYLQLYYYLIHIITPCCQTNNSGGLRIESIWFLNRELDDEFTKWA